MMPPPGCRSPSEMLPSPESPAQAPDSPWLSVLVPAYRVEAWLPACLDSVLSQYQPGIEVLVLDDASPDASGAIAREYAARHPGGLRVLAHGQNRGLAAARNTLLAAARGDYVWFLDSDDVLLPGAIAGLAAVVRDSAPDLVMCDFALLRERPRLHHRLRRRERHTPSFRGPADGEAAPERLALGLLGGGQLHAWSKIARRSVWQQAPFPEGRYFEDIPTIPALVRAVRRWHHVASPWVGYRQRAGSILASDSPAKVRDLLLGLRELHAGLATPAMASARGALDAYVLRTLASAARRLRRLSGRAEPEALAPVQRLHAEVLAACFPDGGAAVLRAWRRQGAWLRAWRIGQRLGSLAQGRPAKGR